MPSCAMNKEIYSQISSLQDKLIISKFLDSKTTSFGIHKLTLDYKINFRGLIDKF